MDKKIILYKPRFFIRFLYFLGCVIMFSFTIMSLWVFLSPEVPVGMKVIMTIFIFLSFLCGVYLFGLSIYVRLEFSDGGIRYSEPLYSVFCEWKDVSNFQFIRGFSFIILNKNTNVKEYRFHKIFLRRTKIPLSYFVEGFDKLEYWQKDPILLELQKRIPNLSDEVKKALS